MFYRKFVFGSGSSGTDKAAAGGSRNGEEAQASSLPECILVRAWDLYSPEKGYGFVTEVNRREQELLRLPELNSAFEPVYWYQDRDLTHIEEDEKGCFLDSDREIACLEQEAGETFAGEHRRIPLSFKADVPSQGNYKVTVTVRSENPEEEVLIFTGRRRLGHHGEVSCREVCHSEDYHGENICGKFSDEKLSDEKLFHEEFPDEKLSHDHSFCGKQCGGNFCGDSFEGSDICNGKDCPEAGSDKTADKACIYTMTVNICDIIPRGQTKCYEDKTLDITILADKPGISAVTVEELDCPTVFIAGDSTVTDQSGDYPYAPGTSYCGWGQMIAAYLTEKVAVSNHAHSGLTTHTFRQEGHYAIVERYIRPGDYYFCQFGHNDQKLAELKAEGGYRENLLRYIRECRERGVFPVLLTPIARNTWKGNDGTYNDLLEEYVDSCVGIGKQEDIPVLDLHGRSMDFIVKKGLEASKAYFFPGDYTHSNDYGAYFMAGLVAEEILRVCGARKEPEYRFLAECVRLEGFGAWPPAERIVSLKEPAVLTQVSGQAATADSGEELTAGIENPEEPADRVSALDMVIKTMKFFPTNVYNDMFTDVVGHEWFAGTVECAWQNGMIIPELAEEGKFYPLRPVTLEEFLVFAVNGYKSRKTIPAEYQDTPCMYDGKCREFARPYIRAACTLGWIPADGSAEPGKVITRGKAAEICRKMETM